MTTPNRATPDGPPPGPGQDRPARPPRDPSSAIDSSERLAYLVHEVGNLVDGSLRSLNLARAGLARAQVAGMDDVDRRLDTAGLALERVCELLHSSMFGVPSAFGSAEVSKGPPITLAEAVAHAVEVGIPPGVAVLAQFDVSEDAGRLPAGPIYAVLLNAVRNAAESIGRCGRPGHLLIRARVEPSRRALVEIADTGAGLPPRQDPQRYFRPGVSTKPAGAGLGLAIARDIVRGLGGAIDLVPRADGQPGAVLRLAYPVAAVVGTGA